EVDTLDVEQTHTRTNAAMDEWERLRPVSRELVEWEAEGARLTRDLESRRELVHVLGRRAEALPHELTAARARLQSAEGAMIDVSRLSQDRALLRARHAAHERAQHVEIVLAPAVLERDRAVAALHSAKESWLMIREQRLDGMAAEIALAL